MTQTLLPQFLRTVLLLMLKNNCLLGKMIGLLANVQLKSDYSENEINYGGKVAVVLSAPWHLTSETLTPDPTAHSSQAIEPQTWGFSSHEKRGKGQEDSTGLERNLLVSGPRESGEPVLPTSSLAAYGEI